MKEIRAILLFLLGTTFIAALLAPWLYWAGNALAARGIARFLAETEFSQYFDRAALIGAVALLWPVFRAVRIRSRSELGIERDPRGWQNLGAGFFSGFIFMAAFGILLLNLGVYRMKSPTPWDALAKVAVSAFTVAVLEEWLFRGAILGIFRRALSPWGALASVSALFSIIHFVRPPSLDIPPEQIDWLTGFRVLPSCFVQFSEPALLGAGFTTLFLVGWILGWAALRTRSLWLSIGLHAGLVFSKFGFTKLTKRSIRDTMPWLGEDMIVGVGAITVVLLSGALVWMWCQYADRLRSTPRR